MLVAILIVLFDLSQAGAERRQVSTGSPSGPALAALAAAAQDRDTSSGARRNVAPTATTQPVADPFTAPAVVSYLASVTATDLTAALYDLSDGQSFAYRPGVTQTVASIIKVDILTTLLAANARTHTLLSSQQEFQTKEMIAKSDDDDAQALWNAEGAGAGVAAFDQQVGMTQTELDPGTTWGLSTTSATDQVQLLRAIASPGAALDDASRNYTLRAMRNVEHDQAWGVSAGVPSGVTVAIKNGWLPLATGTWQVNSLGIIQGRGANYVIAVLTSGSTTEQGGIRAIEGLSRLLWPHLAHGG